MLDPGASAFLACYGLLKRYVEHLRVLGFPLEKLELHRCNRRDAASIAKWSVMLPVFLDGRCVNVFAAWQDSHAAWKTDH